jgi:hypothetical protein
MQIHPKDTAVVFIDPQNDVLSGKIIVPAQTRTLRKREETFSAADL